MSDQNTLKADDLPDFKKSDGPGGRFWKVRRPRNLLILQFTGSPFRLWQYSEKPCCRLMIL